MDNDYISTYLISPVGDVFDWVENIKLLKSSIKRITDMAKRVLGEHFVSCTEDTRWSGALVLKTRSSVENMFQIPFKELFGWLFLFLDEPKDEPEINEE